MSVLAPLGLLVRSVRVGIDWRLGHFALAISQGEAILDLVEEYKRNKPKSRTCHRVLIDFYTLLTRAYLHMGNIDEAMGVVIRAKRFLGRDYLADLVGVDAKTAQLVRAGLSAGRLLDGEGLATLFVKSPPVKNSKANSSKNSQADKVEGASKTAPTLDTDKDNTPKSRQGNVLPFPKMTQGENSPEEST